MRLIRKTVFFLLHLREFVRLVWAHQRGRSDYLRDTSDAVVGKLADINVGSEGVTEELKAVVAQAVAERQRRQGSAA